MFKEDLDVFLDPAEFGLVIRWNGDEYNGIFDNTTVAADVDGVVQVDSQQPALLVKDEDFSGIKQGDVLNVSDPNLNLDQNYAVTAVAPDGTGMTTLALNLV